MQAPNRKVSVGGLAGALSVILVAILRPIGIVLDAEVSSAMTTLLTFVTAYFVKEPE